MSRQLPERPNLEHLKNQAKDLLDELQRQNPAAQLADAQHSLAREYGFASWPKLKAHVERAVAVSARAAHPFVGRWTANLAKSKRHPANEFRSATIEFDVSGDRVNIIDVVVDHAGREERRVNNMRVDGVERAAENSSGYSLRAAWRTPRVLETIAWKDGAIAGTATYEVSPDGTTMTITGDQMSIVLDRVGPVGSAV
jgi:hypothetical protein